MSKGKKMFFFLQVWGEVSFTQISKEISVISPIFLYSIKEYFDFPLIIKVMGHWVTDYYMLWL